MSNRILPIWVVLSVLCVNNLIGDYGIHKRDKVIAELTNRVQALETRVAAVSPETKMAREIAGIVEQREVPK